jgi:hypothetical protein
MSDREKLEKTGMTSIEYKARCKERRMLFHRILMEKELQTITEKHSMAALAHQQAMYELQEIIYERDK